MLQVNIHQAKTQLSKLLQEVAAGRDVIIAKAGEPVARVTAYKQVKTLRKPGALKWKISASDDFDDEDEEINKMFYNDGKL